jgi:hypothetical protein
MVDDLRKKIQMLEELQKQLNQQPANRPAFAEPGKTPER